MQEENTTGVIFARILRQTMRDRSLTQADLAERIGVTQAAVSKWINGTVPKGDQLLAVAGALGVKMEWLLTGSKSPSLLELYRLARAETKSGIQTPLVEKLVKAGDEEAFLTEILEQGSWSDDEEAQFAAMQGLRLVGEGLVLSWWILDDFLRTFFKKTQSSIADTETLQAYLDENIPMLQKQMKGFELGLKNFVEIATHEDKDDSPRAIPMPRTPDHED